MKPISQALILGFLSICCVGYSQAPVETVPPPAPTIRIALVGDSTQTKNAGYGLGFCANLTGSVTCINDAKGGASTKTYYQEGYWTKALADKPDYMLIQFGHNDEESKDHLARETNLQTEYPVNLKRYVEEARAHGIIPILVTPLTRRYYEVDGKIHSDLLAVSYTHLCARSSGLSVTCPATPSLTKSTLPAGSVTLAKATLGDSPTILTDRPTQPGRFWSRASCACSDMEVT